MVSQAILNNKNGRAGFIFHAGTYFETQNLEAIYMERKLQYI